MNRRDELIQKHVNKSGLRGKIDAMCISCIYDEVGGKGSWRQQVENCTVTVCPLYDVRPKSTGKASKSGPESENAA